MTAKKISAWECDVCHEWYYDKEDADECCDFEPPIPDCKCGEPAFRHKAVLRGSGAEAFCTRCPCRKYEPC